MKGTNLIGGAVLALLGVAGIKLYGEYKYYCGRVDCHEFYTPIIETLHDYIVDLNKELDRREA